MVVTWTTLVYVLHPSFRLLDVALCIVIIAYFVLWPCASWPRFGVNRGQGAILATRDGVTRLGRPWLRRRPWSAYSAIRLRRKKKRPKDLRGDAIFTWKLTFVPRVALTSTNVLKRLAVAVATWWFKRSISIEATQDEIRALYGELARRVSISSTTVESFLPGLETTRRGGGRASQ